MFRRRQVVPLPKKMQFGKQHSTLAGDLPWLVSRRAELAIGSIEGMTRRMTQMSVSLGPSSCHPLSPPGAINDRLIGIDSAQFSV